MKFRQFDPRFVLNNRSDWQRPGGAAGGDAFWVPSLVSGTRMGVLDSTGKLVFFCWLILIVSYSFGFVHFCQSLTFAVNPPKLRPKMSEVHLESNGWGCPATDVKPPGVDLTKRSTKRFACNMLHIQAYSTLRMLRHSAPLLLGTETLHNW